MFRSIYLLTITLCVVVASCCSAQNDITTRLSLEPTQVLVIPPEDSTDWLLQQFRAYPLQCVKIHVSNTSCDYASKVWLRYDIVNADTFQTRAFDKYLWALRLVSPYPKKREHNEDVSLEPYTIDSTFEFYNTISVYEVNQALSLLTPKQQYQCSIKDFYLSQRQRDSFCTLITSIANFNTRYRKAKNEVYSKELKKRGLPYLPYINLENKDFFLALAKGVDTVSNQTLLNFYSKPNYYITYTECFTMYFINEKDDTLTISFEDCSLQCTPWYLPWTVEYKGKRFKVYAPNFSRFVARCIKEDFLSKERFDNVYFLAKLSEYMYKQNLTNNFTKQ